MISRAEDLEISCGISPPFGGLSPTSGQVTHVLLTRLPLYSRAEARFLVRLACVKHAASVRSEPGSNSPVKVGSDGSTARFANTHGYAAHYRKFADGLSRTRTLDRALRAIENNSSRKTGTFYLVFKEHRTNNLEISGVPARTSPAPLPFR